MPIQKFGKLLTMNEARELVKESGFLLEDVLESVEPGANVIELKKLANTWWLDHMVETILYYKEHPDALKQIIENARGKGLVGKDFGRD